MMNLLHISINRNKNEKTRNTYLHNTLRVPAFLQL